MAACVEIWESDPEALHYHGSGYIALGPPSQEPDLAEVFERQQRIGYPSRAAPRRATGRAPTCAACTATGAREGLSVCLHEHARRLRLQPRVDARPGRARRARPAPQIAEGVEVTGLRVRRLGRGDRGPDERRARSRSSRSSSPSAPGSRGCGRCSGSPTGSTSAVPTAASTATCRCGPTGTCRRARSSCRRRRCDTDDGARVARPARRLRPPACATTTAPLLTDEPWGIYVKPDRDVGPGRRRAAAPSVRASRSTPTRPAPSSRGFPGPLVRGALALHGALRGLPRRSTASCARAAPARSRPTTSRSSTACARTSTSPRTPTTATR